MTESMKPPPTKPQQPARPEAVRVRRLRFTSPIDMPGSSMPTSITAKSEPLGTTRYAITFEPWHRHHRIEWFEPGKTEASGVRMVHESRVDSWEPW